MRSRIKVFVSVTVPVPTGGNVQYVAALKEGDGMDPQRVRTVPTAALGRGRWVRIDRLEPVLRWNIFETGGSPRGRSSDRRGC